ncbi:MAG: hypothetical protein R2788_07935 [Saprospiraceae bacterium]
MARIGNGNEINQSDMENWLQKVQILKIGASGGQEQERPLLTGKNRLKSGSALPEGIRYQKVSVTMRTPGNDEELALGFLFTRRHYPKLERVEKICPTGTAKNNQGKHHRGRGTKRGVRTRPQKTGTALLHHLLLRGHGKSSIEAVSKCNAILKCPNTNL